MSAAALTRAVSPRWTAGSSQTWWSPCRASALSRSIRLSTAARAPSAVRTSRKRASRWGFSVRSPKALAQDGAGPGVAERLGAGQGEGDQIGVLALPYVVTHRFARSPRVAEDAEEVVAELEGQPGPPARQAQRADQGGGRAAQGRAQLQGAFGAVEGALETGHAQRRRRREAPLGLGVQIEELAGHHLRAHRPPRLLDPLPGRPLRQRLGEHVVGPGQREVAGEGRHRRPVRLGAAEHPLAPVAAGEVDVEGRAAAAQRGVVHQVVVDQRAGLEQFQGPGEPEGGGLVAVPRAPSGGAPAPPQEGGARPFAPVQREPCDIGGQPGAEEAVEAAGLLAPAVGVAPQGLLETAAELAVGSCRFAAGRGGRQVRVRRPPVGAAGTVTAAGAGTGRGHRAFRTRSRPARR